MAKTRALGSGEVYYKGRSIQLPPEVAHQISLRAAEIVRRTAPLGPNNSRRFIRATWQRGQIGVHIPPRAIHLLYLDRGIRPFVMKSLEGKTIPMRGPDGSIQFRTAKNVGKPQIMTRDESGRIIYSKLRWRFPGIEPMNFIQPAINQAIEEYFKRLPTDDMLAMLQRMPGPIGAFFGRIKKRQPRTTHRKRI